MEGVRDSGPVQWTDPNVAEEVAEALEAVQSERQQSQGGEAANVHAAGSEDTRPSSPASAHSEGYEGLSDDENEHERSSRSSFSHWDPEAGFAYIDGDVDGPGYNETKVDIVAVPCPGADPVETWTRDPLPDNYFGLPDALDLDRQPTVRKLAGETILTPVIDRHLPRASHLWVRQGIRKATSTARVLLYRHREVTENVDLDTLAHDLLDHILEQRGGGCRPSRPIFFIAHSLGGLVVKLALLKAVNDERYRGILYNCHGLTFFATPHRGSSYMSMPNLRESIQVLLHLQHPIPRSIAHLLRLGNKTLQKIHDDFTSIASEMRIWSFYETIDSALSGTGFGMVTEVEFSAPLVSIKSGLVGVRQENVYSSLESDHVNCASFGPRNPKTMAAYLQDLALAVAKAADLSDQYIHTPLKLKEKVKVELIGFYDDPDAETESAIRLYLTKYHLAEFLEKGPDRCLEERLAGVPRRHGRHSMGGGRRSTGKEPAEGNNPLGLGIWNNVQKLLKATVSDNSLKDGGGRDSPDIVVTSPATRPAIPGQANSTPAAFPRRGHSLTVPSLAMPGFRRPSSRASTDGSVSTMSDPAGDEISPKDKRAVQGHQHSHSLPKVDQQDFDPTMQSRAERVSTVSALQDMTAGFSRPSPKKKKFIWIHLPFTNPPWVKDIFDTLSETSKRNFSKLYNNEHWVSRHVQGRHSESQPSFVRPACAYIPFDSLPSPRASPRMSPKNSGTSSPAPPGTTPSYLYLYLPYLHYDTYLHIIKRRYIIERRKRHGRARPVPPDIADLESLEFRVIWEYLGFDPPLNVRRTLDQFGYPSLKDTYSRDDDQMLYKLTKEGVSQARMSTDRAYAAMGGNVSVASTVKGRSTAGSKPLDPQEGEKASEETEADLEADVRDGNVLMIDQLWLWAIDTTTLATFFPKRESRPVEGPMFQQADLRNSVYNELNGDLTGRCENALDLAAFIVLHAVTVLLDRSSHPDLEVFRIFEEAIGMLTERMTFNMKRFRMQTFKEIVIDDSDLDDPADGRTESIKKRHKREMEQAERENRENTSALLELRDMEDELTTLLHLFRDQTGAIETMNSIYSSDALKGITHNGRAYLSEALSRLEGYKTQTEEMLKRVDTTRKDYEKLLEMAQRQAQVDDVRWSRLQTELASSQNLSVMVFTTFTVIFLPLTFFTGLFGMNTMEWEGDAGKLPTIGYIGAISLPVSAFLIIGSLIAAFNERVQGLFRIAFKHLNEWFRTARRQLQNLEPEAARLAKIKRKVAAEEREMAERRAKAGSYDFWDNVRRQRNSQYEIPDVNKKSTVKRGMPMRGTWRSGETK